ncbi:MAG: RHS repeat-associated core domain-containing protein, partial [Phycisphaerae bacterium]|nr:RHS repeat-associated core domain-containing protein [Phycisphaerae bacterium]
WTHVEYDPYGGQIVATDAGGLAHPFRYSTKYWDGVFEKHYYGYRYSDYTLGRWMSRDPSDELGGVNLYVAISNDPVNECDPAGLWSLEDHERLTRLSFRRVRNALPVSDECLAAILGALIAANKSQDLAHFFDYERHYNRPVAKKGQKDDKAAWDRKYGRYLVQEDDRFGAALNASPPDCDSALTSIGLLTHSWQDFYAHAIRRDGMGGKENSSFPGWIAWTGNPPVTGSPLQRDSFWPSSYSLFGGGEHPPKDEPLRPNGREYKARFVAAEAFVAARLSGMLATWYAHCPCWCEKVDAR